MENYQTCQCGTEPYAKRNLQAAENEHTERKEILKKALSQRKPR